MFTLFSIPKPFKGHIEIIQRNAIQSWTLLRPECEVILFGDDYGVAEISNELKIEHIPNISKNKFGTPLLNDVFEKASKIAKYDMIGYVNADIILMSDFIKAVNYLQKWRKNLLIAGRRWNVDIIKPIDFISRSWENEIKDYIKLNGKLQSMGGSDYFVFQKNSKLSKLPPFTVGRPCWDNWLIYKSRQLKIPLIDATKITVVTHQNHDYKHVANQRMNAWDGPEADQNFILMGGRNYRFSLLDATHIITSNGKIRNTWHKKYLQRRWQTFPILFPRFRIMFIIINKIINCYKMLFK